MVLRIDGTIGGNNLDWFESRIARPDWAVAGLSRCLHKDSTKTFRYFRNIAEGEAPEELTAAMCEESLPLCGEGNAAVLPLLGDGTTPSAPTGGNSVWYIVGALLVLVLVGVAGFLFASRQGQQ